MRRIRVLPTTVRPRRPFSWAEPQVLSTALAVVLSTIGVLLPALVDPAPAVADDSIELSLEQTQLMDADRAFSTATAEQGATGWASFFLGDGVMFPDEGRIDGQEAIEKYMTPALGLGRPLLRWEPKEAVVAHSGEIGWTLGRWEMVSDPGGPNEMVLARGNYVTLWQKDESEEWKVAVDIGNDDKGETP